MNASDVACALRGRQIAILCEGSAERVVAEILLEQGLMPFAEDDVIRDLDTDRPTLPRMKGERFSEVYLGQDWGRGVTVVRILDSLKERFVLPKRDARNVPVLSFHTRPEIERLVLLNEHEDHSWQRAKKKFPHPSDYCKVRLRLGRIKNEDNIREYWQSDPEALRKAIVEYRRIAHLEKGELSLYELIESRL